MMVAPIPVPLGTELGSSIVITSKAGSQWMVGHWHEAAHFSLLSVETQGITRHLALLTAFLISGFLVPAAQGLTPCPVRAGVGYEQAASSWLHTSLLFPLCSPLKVFSQEERPKCAGVRLPTARTFSFWMKQLSFKAESCFCITAS